MLPTTLPRAADALLANPLASRAACSNGSSGVVPRLPATPRRHLGGARRVRGGSTLTRAADLEQIDPMTGEVVTGTVIQAVPSETLEAGGLTWAYRHAAPDADKADPAVPPVLLLHGLGSSSYCYRESLSLLASDGVAAYAVDWPGHGSSSKPPPSSFNYSEKAYIDALNALVDALPCNKPVVLGVHGFVLSQYAMLWALDHPDKVAKLLVLNSPLSAKSALRPELAAFKAPLAFMRPKGWSENEAMNFNAAGSPYAMQYQDAQAFAAPYAEPEASVALVETLAALDFPALCKRVDEGYCTWRLPSLLVWGSSDPFVSIKNAFDFLDSKRTCMRLATMEAKLGHMPQEDYAAVIHKPIMDFLKAQD